jgi:hypothetical protein
MAQLKQLGVMVPLEYVHERGTRRRVLNPKPLLESCTPASRESCAQEVPKKFHKMKEKTEIIETLSRPVSAPAPEQPSSDPYPDTWEKPTGFDIPDKDLESIANVIKANGMNVGKLPRELLAWMVYTVWMRATRPERHWKAFYAAAVTKILSSDAAYRSAWKKWEAQFRLYVKWMRDSSPADPVPLIMHALTHPDGYLDKPLAQALNGVRVDYDSEWGLVSFSTISATPLTAV